MVRLRLVLHFGGSTEALLLLIALLFLPFSLLALLLLPIISHVAPHVPWFQNVPPHNSCRVTVLPSE